MEAVEAVARALAIHHFARRYGRPLDNDVVQANANVNWPTFVPEAKAAIEAYETSKT